jgi:hypothetical protein
MNGSSLCLVKAHAEKGEERIVWIQSTEIKYMCERDMAAERERELSYL